MTEFPVNLEGLEKEDIYSVATAFLYSLKGTPKYSVISELFYILDYSNFLKLIKYYGGTEIRIPTSEEINSLLKYLLLYQYHTVEELPWKESLVKSGIPIEESASARSKLMSLSKLLDVREMGGRNYD